MKHLVVFTEKQAQELLNGQLKFDVRFFKKKPEFLSKIAAGDIVYFRKKGEVLGQFEIGKIIIIENSGIGDWDLIRGFESGLNREVFETKTRENNILVIIQITKLEQFITSPIEIDKRSKKEWIILDGN